ncbi:hypothetical protein RYX36_016782 [Vicia faba]
MPIPDWCSLPLVLANYHLLLGRFFLELSMSSLDHEFRELWFRLRLRLEVDGLKDKVVASRFMVVTCSSYSHKYLIRGEEERRTSPRSILRRRGSSKRLLVL